MFLARAAAQNCFPQLLTSHFNDAAGAALVLSVLKQESCDSQEGQRNVRSAGGGFLLKNLPLCLLEQLFEERFCSASKPSLI